MADSIASLMVVIDAAQAALAAQKLDEVTVAGGKTEEQFKKTETASKGMLAGLQGIPASLQAIDARVDALRASVDPLAAAQRKVNAELNEAKGLYAGGALSVQEYQNAVAVLEGRLETIASAQNAYNAAQARGARQMGLTAAESLNLSRQMSDVAVSLAMGMNPLMVLIQQGPQIADTFSAASARGVGFSAALRGMVASAGPALPVLAGLAGLAATLAGAAAIAANQLNKTGESADELQKRLGLTDEQMKKVKNTSVTMGDVVAGSAKFAGDKLMEAFGPALAWVGEQFQKMIDWIARTTISGVKVIGGTFRGALEAIGKSWQMLPGAAGDAVMSAANLVIKGVESMINKIIPALNTVIRLANEAAQAVGASWRLPELTQVSLGRLANPFAGQGKAAGDAFGAAFVEGLEKWSGRVDSTLGDWRAAIYGARDSRVMGEAGDPAKSRAGGGSRSEAEDVSDLSEALRDFNREQEQRNRLAERYAEVIAALPSGIDLERAEHIQILRDQQEALNAELWRTADLWADIDAQAQDAGRGMASAFGKAGGALGDLMTLTTRYMARQAELTARRRADGVTAEEVARIDRETSRNKIALYGDMLGAAKGFFSEQSDAYKALQAVEAGYRAWQFAASIQAAIQAQAEAASKIGADNASTTSHLANAAKTMATDAATTSTGIAAGASRIFAALGPFGFPVVAAMLGVMASLGAGGGGGGASGVQISQRRQERQGTGTVLGDTNAKSESIARSLEIVASNSNRDLEYSNQMLRSLRSIDNQIGAVAAAVARSMGAGGALDTSTLKLGTTGTAPSLSNLGFSSSTTKTLVDQGIQFVSQTVADIVSGGIDAAAYNTIKTSSKKTAFGITYSSSTKTKTSTTALEDDLQTQLSLLVGSLRDGVLSAAAVLGVTGAQATLDSFALNLGKISLKGMTGTEIEEAINAVFSAAADDMAGAVIPGLTALQKVGEGLFETLTRVARQYQVVDISLSSIGMTFGAVGVSSLAARERLVDLFGGLDEFTDSVSAYAEAFLTEAERMAPIQTAVRAEMARLNLAWVDTREEFASVVKGLDLTTAAGAELFAALMSIAPAFDKVATAYDEAVAALTEAQDRVAELQQEAADKATEAAIAALDAIASAAQTTLNGAESALQAAEAATGEARNALTRAYEQERSALLSVVNAVDAARATLLSAYKRERDALLAVAQGVETAKDALRSAWEAQRSTMVDAYEAQREAAVSAFETQREAAVSAFETQREAVITAYEAQREAILASVASVDDARSVLADAYGRERDALLSVADGVETARGVLSAAYEREANALQQTIDKFAGFADSLSKFRGELAAGDAAILGPIETLQRRQAAFRSIAGSRTDEALGGGIQSAGQAYIDAALSSARNATEYNRAVAEVMRAVDAAERDARTKVDVPTQQLAVLKAQVQGLIDIDESVVTVSQAIAGLQTAQQANAQAQQQLAALDASVAGLGVIAEAGLSVEAGIEALRAAMASDATAQAQLAALDANHLAQLATMDANQAAQLATMDANHAASLAAMEQANLAELAALDAQVGALIDINTSVLSVEQAIANLNVANDNNATALASLAALDAQVAGLIAVNDNVVTVAQAIAGLQTAQDAATAAQAQIDALDAQVAALGLLNEATVSVATGVTNLLAAQQAQATAQATRDGADAVYQAAQLAVQQAQLAYDAQQAAREEALFAGQLAAANAALAAAQAGVAALTPSAVLTPAAAPDPTGVTGAADMAAELRALREEVALLRREHAQGNADLAAIRQSNEATAKSAARFDNNLNRVTQGGQAILTEAA